MKGNLSKIGYDLFVLTAIIFCLFVLEGCAHPEAKQRAFIAGCMVGTQVTWMVVTEQVWVEDWNMAANTVCEEYEKSQRRYH